MDPVAEVVMGAAGAGVGTAEAPERRKSSSSSLEETMDWTTAMPKKLRR